MMSKKPFLEKEVFYFQDLLAFILSKKKILIKFTLFFYILSLIFALLLPLTYTIKASFKEGSIQTDSLSKSMIRSLLIDGVNLESSTHTSALMQSRKICFDAIGKSGLQAKIKEKNLLAEIKNRIFSRLLYAFNQNLSLESILISDVNIKEDWALNFKKVEPNLIEIRFGNNRVLIEEKNQRVNLPFGTFNIEFLAPFKKEKNIVFSSLEKTFDKINGKFKVKPRREEPSVLDLSFEDRFKARGVNFLNSIISSYQEYQKKEHATLSSMQLSYLDQRKQTLQKDLEETLHQHADYLKEAVGEKGFLSLHLEVEQLEKAKEENASKDQKVELKLKNLEELASQKSLTYLEDVLGQEGYKLQQKLLFLDKEQSIISANLSTYKKFHLFKNGFNHSLNQEKIEKNDEKMWFLAKGKKDPLIHNQTCDLKLLKEQEQKILQEEEALLMELKCLDKALLCQTAQEIHFWDKEVSEIASWRDLQGIEISIKEKHNYTEKEREIAQEQLLQKKEEIHSYLKQKKGQLEKKLLLLKQTLYRNLEQKSLQIEKERKIILDQIDKKSDQKKRQLLLEKQFLDEKKEQILLSLKNLPEKWVLDQKLNIESQMLLSIIEAVAQMVESKNIEFHLSHLQSYPIDTPYAATKPHVFSLVMFPTLFSLVSLFFTLSLFVGIQIYRGFPASIQGLRERGLDVFESLDDDAIDLFINYIKSLNRQKIFLFCKNESKIKVAIQEKVGGGFGFFFIKPKTPLLDKENFFQNAQKQTTTIFVFEGERNRLLLKSILKSADLVLYEYTPEPFEKFLELFDHESSNVITFSLK